MNPRIAVYPGSFDPITYGHIDIIERIAKLYDEVWVLVAESSIKESLFSAEERVVLAKKSLRSLKNVSVCQYQGLTVDFVRAKKAQVIVRGLRAMADFEYEFGMGNMNMKVAPEIETILVFARPEFSFVSSRAVKELVKHKGDASAFVPQLVVEALEEKLFAQKAKTQR